MPNFSSLKKLVGLGKKAAIEAAEHPNDIHVAEDFLKMNPSLARETADRLATNPEYIRNSREDDLIDVFGPGNKANLDQTMPAYDNAKDLRARRDNARSAFGEVFPQASTEVPDLPAGKANGPLDIDNMVDLSKGQMNSNLGRGMVSDLPTGRMNSPLSPEKLPDLPAGKMNENFTGNSIPDLPTGEANTSLDADMTPLLPKGAMNSSLDASGMSGKAKLATAAGIMGLGGGLFSLINGNDSGGNPDHPMTSVNAPDSDAIPLGAGQQSPSPVKQAIKAAGRKGTAGPGVPATPASVNAPGDSQTIDFGSGYKDTADALKDVQKREDDAILVNQLGKAGEIIGSGISHARPVAEDMFDQNIKLAGNITKDYKEQMAKQKDDPNSPLSQGLRGFLKQMGISVKGDASASDMEKLTPLAEKWLTAKDNREARAMAQKQHEDTMRYHWAALASSNAKNKDDKQSAANEKRIDALGKMLEPGMQSRSGLGADYKAVAAIQNAKALIDGEADLNNLDVRQIAELARVLDRAVSGGNPTISGSEHLTPDSAKMHIAKLLEMADSQRHGAGGASFVKTMSDTFDRENKTAMDRIRGVQGHLLAPYIDLKDNPRVQMMMASQGLPIDFFDRLQDTQTKRTADYAKVKELMGQGMTLEDATKQVAGPSKLAPGNAPKTSLTPVQQTKIQVFMKNNPNVKSESEAAKILQDHGRL